MNKQPRSPHEICSICDWASYSTCLGSMLAGHEPRLIFPPSQASGQGYPSPSVVDSLMGLAAGTPALAAEPATGDVVHSTTAEGGGFSSLLEVTTAALSLGHPPRRTS